MTVTPASARSGPEDQPGTRSADATNGLAGEPVAPAVPSDADSLPRAFKLVAAVVAPTTLITALLIYFGVLYAVGYFRYFGVNYTVLGLPTQDYLILSADAAIVPLLILATATLLALWVRGLPIERTTGRTRWVIRRLLAPAVFLMGAVLVALTAADALFGAPVFPATFWAVGSYAIEVGAAGAQGLADDLRCTPDIVLYSEKSLNLHIPGIVETVASTTDAAYGFRYSGLKLVPQSGDHYLFLPAGWTPTRRAAILLPRGDTVRLEFIAVGGCP